LSWSIFNSFLTFKIKKYYSSKMSPRTLIIFGILVQMCCCEDDVEENKTKLGAGELVRRPPFGAPRHFAHLPFKRTPEDEERLKIRLPKNLFMAEYDKMRTSIGDGEGVLSA
jgi:hypothetical protein